MESGILDFRLVNPRTVSVFLDANDKELQKSGTCRLTITVPIFILKPFKL